MSSSEPGGEKGNGFGSEVDKTPRVDVRNGRSAYDRSEVTICVKKKEGWRWND